MSAVKEKPPCASYSDRLFREFILKVQLPPKSMTKVSVNLQCANQSSHFTQIAWTRQGICLLGELLFILLTGPSLRGYHTILLCGYHHVPRQSCPMTTSTTCRWRTHFIALDPLLLGGGVTSREQWAFKMKTEGVSIRSKRFSPSFILNGTLSCHGH